MAWKHLAPASRMPHYHYRDTSFMEINVGRPIVNPTASISSKSK